MNPALGIDFARDRPRPAWPAILACLLAAGACGAALLGYRAALGEVDRLSAEAEGLHRRLQERPGAGRPLHLQPGTVAGINRAITQLNLPWRDLFDIFETRTLPTVTLLSLEPDSRRGLVRVGAEAKGLDDMADFLALLVAEPRFSEVVLTKYEIQGQDKNQPIRFYLEAHWKPPQ